MRPDDRLPPVYGGAPPELDLALDAGLEALDAELAAAGAQARRALHGRTQPTRVYSVDLRAWLLGRLAPTADRERRSS
jgi:hypothetical protein